MAEPPSFSDDSSHITVRLPHQPKLVPSESETLPRSNDVIELVSGSKTPGDHRYELFREIGHGGMGVVYRGIDRELSRDLAIKVLQNSHRFDPQMVRRFRREALIVGQLQHPGIVPLYDAGRLADGRPFLVMKLIEGRTLSALLAARATPKDRRSHLLKVFEQVCQTIAYAHSRGVIHCDLKPSNIMVGEFGEVQVMDWGLARIVRDADATIMESETPAVGDSAAPAGPTRMNADPAVNSVAAGDILGTPAYMAPEQARGDAERDERTDVFGLGAILCEILTGSPPYPSPDPNEALAQAADRFRAPYTARLENCSDDPDLVQLANACLARVPDSRPANAAAVAAAVAAHFAGAAERAHLAELDRAAAVARAKEERKRRRLAAVFGLALVVLLMTAAVGVVGVFQQRSKRAVERARFEREQEAQAVLLVRQVDQAIAEADRLALLAQRQTDPLPTLAMAVATVRQAQALFGDMITDAELAQRLQQSIRDLESAEFAARQQRADQRMLAQLEEIRLRQSELKNEMFDVRSAPPAYESAFRGYGIDIAALPVEEAERRIVASRIHRELSVALIHWASLLRMNDATENSLFNRLLQVAGRVDSDSWNRDFLDAILNPNPEANQRLVAKLDLENTPAAVVHLFIMHLNDMQDTATAIELARRAVIRYPTDFWLNQQCGDLLSNAHPSRHQEAVRYLTAAVALRPQSPGAHVNLCFALNLVGDYERAVEHCREALRLQPDYFTAHFNLGLNLMRLNRHTEAVAVLRRAVELQPDQLLARVNLADALISDNQTEEAVAVGRRTVEMNRDHPQALLILVRALMASKNLVEAEKIARETAKRFSSRPDVHFYLGNILSDLGRDEEAIVCYRDSIRVAPNHAESLCNLGHSLQKLGRFEEGHEFMVKGHLVGSRRRDWSYPSDIWVRESERWLARDRRWNSIRSGQARPTDLNEALLLAHFSLNRKRDPGAALELFADAFRREPMLITGPPNLHRSRALRAAAQIQSSGDDSTRTRWRSEALAWLRADRDFYRAASKQPTEPLRRAIDELVRDADLKALREADELAKIPEHERTEWESVWTELISLAKQ